MIIELRLCPDQGCEINNLPIARLLARDRPFIEAANAICLMRRRHPHRHVTRLYERTARRKGHPKAIGAVARHLGEARYWLLTKQEPYREPKASAVSSTGDKRDFAISSRKLEF